MANDPNKVYYEDSSGKTTELRRMTRAQRDANYKASRQRFLAQRQKWRDAGGVTRGTAGARNVSPTYNTYE